MVTTDSRTKTPTQSNAAVAVDGTDLRDQVRVLGEDFKELAHLTKLAIGKKVEATKGAAHDVVEQGREKAVQYRDHVADLTRAQPIKSILIAAGIGAVLGLILGRR